MCINIQNRIKVFDLYFIQGVLPACAISLHLKNAYVKWLYRSMVGRLDAHR